MPNDGGIQDTLGMVEPIDIQPEAGEMERSEGAVKRRRVNTDRRKFQE